MNRKPVPDTETAITENPWSFLRRHTSARIGLGRAGISQPTAHHLAFQLDHARARDAVHAPLDLAQLEADLASTGIESVRVRSAAGDRRSYLQRPDLGRRLDGDSARQLAELGASFDGPPELAFVIADGLSALAVQRHAVPFLQALLAELPRDWRIAPLTLIEQGRVAVSDEIGALLRARIVVILIGERPGLSSPDSLGVYMTYAPRVGNTDANRNCLSNIRAAGMTYADAARKLRYLMINALARQLSGVALKDEADCLADAESATGSHRNFLLDDTALNSAA